jgi:hypothetical protein
MLSPLKVIVPLTGNTLTSTIEDFATDALADVEYLKGRSEINPKRIGLIGQSEGGLLAPLAATMSSDIAFIVLMTGPGPARRSGSVFCKRRL